MYQELFHLDDLEAGFQDIPLQPPSGRRRLVARLRAFARFSLWVPVLLWYFAWFLCLILYWGRHRLYANLKAFLSRFLELVRDPRGFAPVIIDCALLMQSIWIGRQTGPDLIYPMLSIGKRQSGHLAKLILEHCRNQQSCELGARTMSRGDIDFPCVAVMDLSQVPSPADEGGFRVHPDRYGIAYAIILVQTIVTLAYIRAVEHDRWNNLFLGILVNLNSFVVTMTQISCTFELIQRSAILTPGCAVLLDRDFTVILNGKRSVVEAIAESAFRRSLESRPGRPVQNRSQAMLYGILEASCEGVGIVILMLCFSIFISLGRAARSLAVTTFLLVRPQLLVRPESREGMATSFGELVKLSARCLILVIGVWACGFDLAGAGSTCATFFYFFLQCFMLEYKIENYPIRSAKLLDVLGHPRVRKWQFNTLAAAVTFQSLVLCHGVPRPVRNINVLAFLDMLIQDETDLWRVWKRRVADRIVHEEDISFTPTIPMFFDEGHQKELVRLLDEAQFAHDTYKKLYAQGAPPDLGTTDDADHDSPTVLALIWHAIRRHFICSTRSINW